MDKNCATGSNKNSYRLVDWMTLFVHEKMINNDI